MKTRYNLVKRLNPSSESKEKLWYATPANKGAMDEDEVAEYITSNTTVAPSEFKLVMELIAERLPSLIEKGFSVTLGKFGKVRLSFGSEGVEDLNEFNPITMIKNPKYIFYPSTNLKSMLSNLEFEQEGIVVDGIKYGSKESYLKSIEGSVESVIKTVKDVKSGKTDGTLTRDGIAVLEGVGLHCVGEDGISPGSVKFYLESEPDTPLSTINSFALNTSTQLIFQIPDDLTEQNHIVTIETYSGENGELLEEPRVIQCPIIIKIV